MMETQNYWEENSTHSMQVKYESLDGRSCKDEIYKLGIGNGYCEGNLNFTIASEDDEVYTKKKVSRQDPMSHRIIEKRRRDRMNNCLADLSRLIPAEYLKKGRGRVEKTEIIEMAIRHMKHLQSLKTESKQSSPTTIHAHPEDSIDSVSHPTTCSSTAAEHYRLGYQECLSETMNFLVEVEGYFARDTLCVQLINHLQQHCEKVVATNERIGFPNHESSLASGNSFSQSQISSISSNNNNNNRFSNTAHNNHHNNYHQNETNGHHSSNNSSPTNVNTNSNNVHSDQGSTSGVSSFGEPERTFNRNGSSATAPVLTSDDSNHSNHSHSSNLQQQRPPPSNYKFKNSIKQRFSADQRFKTSDSPPPVDFNTKHHHLHHGIPIFALHDNGSFYIPLTVEAGILGPHINCNIEHGIETVLHPVTISVNFNHSPPPAWSHQSPIHQA